MCSSSIPQNPTFGIYDIFKNLMITTIFIVLCPNLEELFIHKIETISRHTEQASCIVIPVFLFQNLIHIKLDYHVETQSIYCWWYDVLDMLRLCPKLQIFFIKKVC
jgi:hypothetical protein